MTISKRALNQFRRLRTGTYPNSDCMLRMTALDAWRQVKWEQQQAALPFQHSGDTWETEDGFTVVLRIENDDLSLEYMLGDSYGEITDGKPERDGIDGVILCSDRTYFPNRCHTFEDRLRQYRKAGMSRNVAFLAAMAGLKREADKFETFYNEGLENVWLQCKAYRTDDYNENAEEAEELGEDSIGGTEADYWQSCLLDYKLHENALEAARKAWNECLEIEACALEAANVAFASAYESSRPDMYEVRA